MVFSNLYFVVAFCHYFLVMSQYSIPIKVLKNLSLLGVLKIKKKIIGNQYGNLFAIALELTENKLSVIGSFWGCGLIRRVHKSGTLHRCSVGEVFGSAFIPPFRVSTYMYWVFAIVLLHVLNNMRLTFAPFCVYYVSVQFSVQVATTNFQLLVQQ